MNSGALPTQIGKYWVKRLLGAGGMGRVFLAVDPDIGREVAIKLVTLGSDPQASERFLREAQTMGRLNHPNIVTLLEFGVDQGSPFLVLEFLSGEDLSQWMLRSHTLREQVQVMLDVAQAIAAAHKVGVLHRDLKPENVRVLDDGRCKLLDFGIAQSGAGQLTASGYFVGTPEFVAPEVMSGAAHTAAADIYALGLLYYTMLCGANPFRGDTVQATVARVVQLDPLPLSKKIRGLPGSLELVIQSCLAKQPELRPTSADSLVQALSSELQQIGVDARLREPTPAETTLYPTTPPPSKTQASVLSKAPVPARKSNLAWLLAAVLLAGIASAWWLMRPPEPAVPLVTPPSIAQVEPTEAKPESGALASSTLPAASTTVDVDRPPQPAVKTDEEKAAVPPPSSKPAPGPREPPAAAVEAAPMRVLPQPLKTPPPETTAPTVSVPVAATATVPAPAEPAPAREQPSVPVPAPPANTPAAVATTAQTVQVQVTRYSPRVLRAGRSVTMSLEGSGLAAVSKVTINSGGVADSRFRIRAIQHSGDTLQFGLNVARGVPLGSYALLLQGEGVRADPILLEISL